MRWDNLKATGPPGTLPLALPEAAVRTFDTPGFSGMTFYEIRAKSIISQVPRASRLPFEWTINPYRGCSHACVYCFARNTHTYLDLDAGHDFDTKIIVKVNAAELLRRELAAPSWTGAPIAMGTNVDCYQRAEGRYGLMRGILHELVERANPFSILTKATLVTRDLDLIRRGANVSQVGSASRSASSTSGLAIGGARDTEPTPTARRGATVQRRGDPVTVLMARSCPVWTDTDDRSTRPSGRSRPPARWA
jgi:hypothetical protein